MTQNTLSDTASVAADNMLSTVAETLKNSTDTVRLRLTEMLVERKIASRVDILDKALTKLSELRNEFRKFKPDQTSFDLDGVKAESYSRDLWEKKNKAKESLDKLEKAVEAALSQGSFDKLQELVK